MAFRTLSLVILISERSLGVALARFRIHALEFRHRWVSVVFRSPQPCELIRLKDVVLARHLAILTKRDLRLFSYRGLG